MNILQGNLYMHSFGTKLDCNDCVCLLPNGTLILNLLQTTYERLPIEAKKETAKRLNLQKYGNFCCVFDSQVQDSF